MSAFYEYNPLYSISLPGTEIRDPEGIVVIVGPNSSGKTLLLRDIERYLLTGQERFIVASRIELRRPSDWEAIVSALILLNYLRPAYNNTHQLYLPTMGHYLNSPQAPGSHKMKYPLEHIKTMCKDVPNDKKAVCGFLSYVGQVLVAPLSLEERRQVSQKVRGFDYRRDTPDQPLQALHVNSQAKDLLMEETGKVFGNAVWLDISEAGFYQLRASGTPEPPSVGQMNTPLEAAKFREIAAEGDGYKSYVGTCLSLLVGTRAVALIDEPELCLHPPKRTISDDSSDYMPDQRTMLFSSRLTAAMS